MNINLEDGRRELFQWNPDHKQRRTIDGAGGSVTFAKYAASHRLMELLWANKREEIKARAEKLRKNALSEINVDVVFTKFAARIPAAILAHQCKRWPLLRSTNANNIAQILNWYRLRCIYIDNELSNA